MSTAWRSSHQTISYQPAATHAPLDSRFPRAITGEDYGRYSRAIWPQALRWVRRHWYQVMGDELTMHDAIAILRSSACGELARGLLPQEETLLSALAQEFWHTSARLPRITPEVPTFLVAARAHA